MSKKCRRDAHSVGDVVEKRRHLRRLPYGSVVVSPSGDAMVVVTEGTLGFGGNYARGFFADWAYPGLGPYTVIHIPRNG